MAKKYKDIDVGDAYRRWIVVEKGKKINGVNGRFKQYWICQCSCEKHTIRPVNGESLKNGMSTSCGCVQKEVAKENGIKQRKYNINVGEKYNNWTVISKGKPIGKYTNTYICECDCAFHTRENLRADDIINNTSNGCIKCYKLNDLTGQIFGDLTVVSINVDKSNKEGRMYYNVKCKCNKEYPVRIDALTSGGTTNCGCKQDEHIDLIGQKFRMLTVLDYIGRYSYSNNKNYNTSVNLWKCECDCGNIVTMRQGNFTSGNTYSCGCTKRSHGEIEISKLLNKWNIKYIEQYRFDNCKYKNTLPFDFAIVNDNNIPYILIEFDGEFHDRPIKMGDMTDDDALYNYRLHLIRDEIKNNYCKTNNLPLIRITCEEFYNGELEYILFDNFIKYGAIEEIKIA